MADEPVTDGTVADKDGLIRRRARRLAWLYTAAGVVLLPWIVYLADTLPAHSVDRHYRGAWVGFDIILAVTIITTAYYAFRVDPRVQFPATATAVLLFVDAWFDVTTAPTRRDFLQAVILAVFAEIPAAIFSLVVAHRVNRRSGELERLHRESHLGRLRHMRARQVGPPAVTSAPGGSSGPAGSTAGSATPAGTSTT